MQREKMKYQKPVIHLVEVGQILPIAAASAGPSVDYGGNASGGGGEGGGGGGTTSRPMQSPRNYWGSGFQTDDDDETAYEYGW